VCISSHQARKLLLIPYPLLSVHVYGFSYSFIGHFPWSSHELISPEQASQPWREILIPGRSCSRRNIFHVFLFLHESNCIQEYRLCHSFVRTWEYLRSYFMFCFYEGVELFHFIVIHSFMRSHLHVLIHVISLTQLFLNDGRFAATQCLFIRIN